MKFQKGTPKPANSGRKKGVRNKSTIAVKDALDQTFNKLGGVKAFFEWGKENASEFYHLWVKMLPKEVKTEISGELSGSSVVTEIVVRSREEAAAVLASLTAPKS
jgi:hypothetical protein